MEPKTARSRQKASSPEQPEFTPFQKHAALRIDEKDQHKLYKLKTSLTKISVDHSKEDQVESLFQKIKEEHKRLDILVNNAYAAVNYIMENLGTPFWEKDPAYSWDIVNNVGLRNNYICTVFAAR